MRCHFKKKIKKVKSPAEAISSCQTGSAYCTALVFSSTTTGATSSTTGAGATTTGAGAGAGAFTTGAGAATGAGGLQQLFFSAQPLSIAKAAIDATVKIILFI